MKCPHCESQWNISTGLQMTVQVCPFCGKSLTPQPGENNTMEGVLCSIREYYGMEALKNGRIVLSYFRDLAPKLKRERKMLSEFVDAGGPGILFPVVKKSAQEQQVAMEKVLLCLTDEQLMAEVYARTVCNTYFSVIGGSVTVSQQDTAVEKPTPPKPVAAAVREEPVPAVTREKPTVAVPQEMPVVHYDPQKFEITMDGVLKKYMGPSYVNVVVPDCVRRIGSMAFKDKYLTGITLPNGLRQIDESAFAEGLRAGCVVDLPLGLTHIGNKAFYRCGIKSISLPESLEYIGENAFVGCNIREVTIPGMVKKVMKKTFASCIQLRKVIFSPGVEALGQAVFFNCPLLETAVVPASLTDIAPDAFQCSKNAPLHFVKVQLSEPWKDPGPDRFQSVKNIRY